MKPQTEIKTSEDLNKLSHDELKQIYFTIHSESIDEWFPIMYVTDECPQCGGEAHQLENFKQDYLQLLCFNPSCEMSGKIVDQFLKSDDFYRMTIAYHLEIEY